MEGFTVARHQWQQSRAWLAEYLSSPDTPVEALTFFADSVDGFLRARVAENPSTPQELRDRLTLDTNDRVLAGIIMNPATSVETLTVIATSTIVRGRRRVWQAIRRRTNADLLRKKQTGDADDEDSLILRVLRHDAHLFTNSLALEPAPLDDATAPPEASSNDDEASSARNYANQSEPR